MLLCITAHHRNTSFELLERLAVDAAELSRSVHDAHAAIRGAVSIATCNRLEVYLDIDAPVLLARELAQRSVVEALESLAGVDEAAVTQSADLLEGAGAVHHLFSVAAGLESVAVGEEEIAGQVKGSAQLAREAGTTTPTLDRAFQEATRTARAARAKGDASRTGRSLARLALDLVGSRLADWGGVNVLLVGTGQYAATTVAALRERGADRIRVYSPSGRAQVFAGRTATDATNDLGASLIWADVVVTCTTRLSIGAEVLVPETPCDLKVPVHPADHQNLFEDLWRLRQGEELAGMHAAGHQVVACAFRGGLGEHGRLDVEKALGVERLSRRHQHAVPQLHVPLHPITAQIEVAILQPQVFRHRCLVGDLKRWSTRFTQHRDLAYGNLDFTGLDFRIQRLVGSALDRPAHFDDVFRAQPFGLREQRVVVASDHLGHAVAIPDVDKNQ